MEDQEEIHFLVFVVWHDNDSKKWYLSVARDNPSWPLKSTEKKKYRLGVCAVVIDEIKKVSWKEDIEDGKNMKASMRMVKLGDEKSHKFKTKY